MRSYIHVQPTSDQILRQYIHESVHESSSILVEQILIREGLAGDLKDIFRDVVKVAVGAGAVIGTGGMGGDTVTDMIFAVEGSAEILSEIEAASGAAGDLKDAISAALGANISSGPDAIYDAVLGAAEATAATGGEEALDKAKESIDEVLGKLANAIGEWVATALPDDAGLGGIAIREAIEGVIGVISENVYDALKSAFNSLPATVQGFIADPAAMEAFLNGIIDDLINLLKSTQTSGESGEEEGGIMATVADAASAAVKATPSGMIMSAATEMALPKIIEYLDKDFREMIPTAAKILNTLATVTFGVVALLQILEREEYKDAAEEAAEAAEQSPDAEAASVDAEAAKKSNENIMRLRLLIRHELSRKLI